MKTLTKFGFALVLALPLALGTGCSDDGDDGDTPDAAVGVDAPGDDPYVFRTDAPGDYNRVDRAGMPAIATAVIASKDDYNAANPADDANGDFVGEIVASVDFLHGALDDDLAGLNLTPCTGGAAGSCVAFAAPLVVPDVLKIDPAGAAGFPNGRLLTDPVIDVTLAVVLLEIADGTHGVTDLVGTNPTANDVPFGADFPYLAPAHQ